MGEKKKRFFRLASGIKGAKPGSNLSAQPIDMSSRLRSFQVTMVACSVPDHFRALAAGYVESLKPSLAKGLLMDYI